MKQFSPSSIQALKEALTHIYWRKKDLRSFITHTIKNTTIIGTIDWNANVKYESACQLIDRMLARPDIYREDLLKLFEEVMNFQDLSHLKHWDDSEIKIEKAEKMLLMHYANMLVVIFS